MIRTVNIVNSGRVSGILNIIVGKVIHMGNKRWLMDTRAFLKEIYRIYAEHYSNSYDQCVHDIFNAVRRRAMRYSAFHEVDVSSWIPVSERLPDLELVEARAEDMDLFPCLVVKSAPQSPQKRFVTKAWYDGEGFMDTDCIRITKFVTHWMPLPEPPKEEYNE